MEELSVMGPGHALYHREYLHGTFQRPRPAEASTGPIQSPEARLGKPCPNSEDSTKKGLIFLVTSKQNNLGKSKEPAQSYIHGGKEQK